MESHNTELKSLVESMVLEFLSSNNLIEKEDSWLNLGEAAKYIGVSRNTLKKYIYQEEVKVYGVGGIKRVSKAELDMFLKSKNA